MNRLNKTAGSGARNWSDLNAARLEALSPGDDPRPGFATVWPNILWVAEQFWQAQASRDDTRRLETWHHLVMAVGNFKRQGGTQIRLLEAVPKDHIWRAQDSFPPTCKVQTLTGQIQLDRDDPDSWKQLTTDKKAIQGLQVATATTLLSALWPGSHVIIDIRVLNSTTALNMDEVMSRGWLTPESTESLSVTWDRYDWVRTMLLGKAAELRNGGADVEPVQLERALYTLDQKVPRPKKDEPLRTWQDYADALGEVLAKIA